MKSESSLPLTIVGGGLSGCILALTAISRGIRVRVIDRGNQQAASRAAAGVINPITGMRFSRSWRVDEFLAPAIQFYQQCEVAAGQQMWHPMPVCRLFRSPELRDGFFKRRSLEQLAPYAKRLVEPGEDVGPVQNRFGGVWIEGGGWVDLAALLDYARKEIEVENEWLEQEADIRQLCDQNEGAVIDCRGYQPDADLWAGLPWKPAHGDILTFRSSAATDLDNRILNRAQFILPLGGERFRFGATYEWDVMDSAPTEAGKQNLLQMFDEWVNIPDAECIGQQAGIRPIIRDQKPVLGRHPSLKQLNIFNGMGSKGGLWAPYLAQTLLDFIQRNVPLDQETDVARFYKL